MLLVRVHLDRERAAVGVPQRRLERFGETLFGIGSHPQSIHDDFDGVLHVPVQLRQLVELMHFAVDANADEPLRPQFLEEIRLLALSPDDERCEHHQPRVRGQGQHVIDHLRHALGRERDAVVRTMRISDPGEEESQVIVDLGDRADRRARVVACRFLLDRDGGREAFDQVDIGLLHELEKLPGVGGERFHVAPLSLGVERVERERRLAGAGKSRDDHEAVPRQVEIHVLEVVRACAANPDVFAARAFRPRVRSVRESGV